MFYFIVSIKCLERKTYETKSHSKQKHTINVRHCNVHLLDLIMIETEKYLFEKHYRSNGKMLLW